jgi:hypothetical protein
LKVSMAHRVSERRAKGRRRAPTGVGTEFPLHQ